jgi:hypothetical protein
VDGFSKTVSSGCAAAACLLALAAAGCGPQADRPASGLDESQLDKVFADRQAAIRTLSAKVELAVYDRAKDKRGRMTGTYLVGPKNEFRFRTLGGVATVVFDMAVRDGKLRLAVPSKQRFIEGVIDDVPESRKEMSYLLLKELGGKLLFVPKLKDDRAGRVRFATGDRSSVISSQEKQGALWKVRRDVSVSRQGNQVETMRFYGPRGAPVGRVEYSDYDTIEGTGVPYARKIRIENAAGTRYIEILVESLRANYEVPEEKFAVPEPDAPETQRLRLYDLFEAGQGLWPEGD